MRNRANNNEYYRAKAIEAVLTHGFVQDGETRSEQVRIPTTRVPVYGGVGGELATFGGRLRFAKPGTSMKVTIGKISVCFYQVEKGKEPRDMATISTRQTDRIDHWARSEIAFTRAEADRLGRGDEWVRLNQHVIEAAAAVA